MIHINSYLHRNTFCNLIQRWMYDRAFLHDAELVTRLVHFNNVFISRYLQTFTQKVFQGLHGKTLATRFAPTKRDLKDVIVSNPPVSNQRVSKLISDYHERPERYYRETPFHGNLYFVPATTGELYIGSSRIKRVRRLAEKSARRIIDNIFQAIKQHADRLATDRARKRGVPREGLVSDENEMLGEFLKSESRLLDELRKGRPIDFGKKLEINDVAGIKVILENKDYGKIIKLFQDAADCQIVEEEPHYGKYNAVNLIISFRPDKEEILSKPLSPGMLKLVERRGLDSAQANREFANFVHTGEEEVHIEVIISNYQEMLESEIGLCIHEDRIIEQRLQQEYRGPLAKNVEYLMVYLFSFAVSPQNELGELPIKLWNRYLPDTFDEVIRSLFDLPPMSLME
jgi:hypothetical protein